jgi:hypothetical protein
MNHDSGIHTVASAPAGPETGGPRHRPTGERRYGLLVVRIADIVRLNTRSIVSCTGTFVVPLSECFGYSPLCLIFPGFDSGPGSGSKGWCFFSVFWFDLVWFMKRLGFGSDSENCSSDNIEWVPNSRWASSFD